MGGLILFAIMGGRVQRALRAGDPEAARKLLENHVRRWPRRREGWSFYDTFLVIIGAPFADRLAISRRAFDHLPYRIETFDLVTSNLFHAYLDTGDPGFLKELRMCVTRYEELLGEGPETLIVRSELAQLLGDDVAALGLAKLAFRALEEVRPANMLVKLGACYSSIPGKEALGEELLEEGARSGKDPMAYLILGVIVEGRDPGRGRACIAQARDMLPIEKVSSLGFDRYVESLRERHETELNVRRARKRLPPPPPPMWAGRPA